MGKTLNFAIPVISMSAKLKDTMMKLSGVLGSFIYFLESALRMLLSLFQFILDHLNIGRSPGKRYKR